MNILNYFKITDEKIFRKLGKYAFIRNGHGYGFISEKDLYDNCYLEIGFGLARSGYGDWVEGDYAVDTCLKVVIDKNKIIKKLDTHSFYNSKSSQEKEKIAKNLKDKLRLGGLFHIKDKQLLESVNKIINILPVKRHIGHDVFGSPHMLKHFTEVA